MTQNTEKSENRDKTRHNSSPVNERGIPRRQVANAYWGKMSVFLPSTIKNSWNNVITPRTVKISKERKKKKKKKIG